MNANPAVTGLRHKACRNADVVVASICRHYNSYTDVDDIDDDDDVLMDTSTGSPSVLARTSLINDAVRTFFFFPTTKLLRAKGRYNWRDLKTSSNVLCHCFAMKVSGGNKLKSVSVNL